MTTAEEYTPKSETDAQIFDEVRQFCEETGESWTAVGVAVNNRNVIHLLSRGDTSVRGVTIDRLREYMKSYREKNPSETEGNAA